MESYEKLLLENKAWAQEINERNPHYFKSLAVNQKPDFLWIGCSDSRVPATEVTNSDPGDMFVHRNIANVVWQEDINLMSVVQYAVEVLQVRHVILCGHYGCGGIKAVLDGKPLGLIDKWLDLIHPTYREYKDSIMQHDTEEARINQLVDLNVIQQTKNLYQLDIIQKQWNAHQRPMLHGWVYGLKDGRLKELITLTPDRSVSVEEEG